ncbi:MAG: xanthine dehydrogenase family protein molybdopterin-binding subunit [Burkholderiales bacterium]|nr:xanthine dehydrogenase family protein molybdopterin-binding subunit [Burkholderiales bacterium]
MNAPVDETLVDGTTPTVLGTPLDRVDGVLKVTGAARYAADHRLPDMLYGVMVAAAIGAGRIRAMDVAAVKRAPGVVLVLNHDNAPPQGTREPAAPQLRDARIRHVGQPIALVVATGFEQARDAAKSLHVRYDRTTGNFDTADLRVGARKPKPRYGSPPDTKVGHFDGAFDNADATFDRVFHTPDQSHAAIELHATLAWWEGDAVVIETANQMLKEAHASLAATLRLSPKRVRIVSRYIGGGFGGKLDVCADALLAAMASRMTGRPVKVVMTRQQVFFATSRRPQTAQRVRLGAGTDGRLVAIGHQSWGETTVGDAFWEPAALGTRMLYAAPHRLTQHRLGQRNKPRASSMRAPGEAVGMLALENAMDELAEQLDLDPVELRLRNEPARHPETDVPFSSRNLVACLNEGVGRFGWTDRNPKPRQRREGRFWIGTGMAAAVRGNPTQASTVRLRLHADGHVQLQTSMTDIGTGTYTILTQVAAELLDIAPDRIVVELGDTAFPYGAGSGGSWGAGSSGGSVYDAVSRLRQRLAMQGGIDIATARFRDGALTDGSHSLSLVDAARGGPVEVIGELKPGKNSKAFSQAAYGAHFVEVGVDADTAEVRVRRMLGVFAAGRILNEKTARSQCIGGMIFGIGTALSEQLVMDARYGSFINHDLAEYQIPVHADVPDIEVVFLPELDPASNPLKSKGIGELGISGVGAAITNAIYNAVGVRVRDYPVRLERLLEAMDRAAT